MFGTFRGGHFTDPTFESCLHGPPLRMLDLRFHTPAIALCDLSPVMFSGVAAGAVLIRQAAVRRAPLMNGLPE